MTDLSLVFMMGACVGGMGVAVLWVVVHKQEANVTRQIIDLQARQMEEFRKEANALRHAMFPSLQGGKTVTKGSNADATPPAPNTPAVNMRQPWRQLKKILEAQHNTKQRQHDNLVAGIQKAQERPNA